MCDFFAFVLVFLGKISFFGAFFFVCGVASLRLVGRCFRCVFFFFGYLVGVLCAQKKRFRILAKPPILQPQAVLQCNGLTA